MNKKKVLPVVLIGSMVGEALISARHFDPDVHQHHVECEITLPFASAVSTVTAGMASVIYMSSGFVDKNGGRPGQMTEPTMFPSIEDAMRAPFPAGCESAQLLAENAQWVRQRPDSIWAPR